MYPVELFVGSRAAQPTKYMIGKLTLADTETINNHIRAKIIKAARISLDGCSNPHIRKEVLDSAMRVAGEISLLSGEHAAYFGGVDGNAAMLYYAIVKHRPDFMMDDAVEIVRDERNADEANIAFSYMRGFTPQDLTEIKAKQLEEERKAKADQQNPTPNATDSPPTTATSETVA